MEQVIKKIKEAILENYELTDKIPILDKCIKIEHLDALCLYIARIVSDTVIRDVYSKLAPCIDKSSMTLGLELEQLVAKYIDLK